MKLRVRILLISCIAVFAATFVSGIMMLQVTSKNLRNEAEFKSCQRFSEMVDEIITEFSMPESPDVMQTWLEFFLKTRKDESNHLDDYNICFLVTYSKSLDDRVCREIYNHTSLSFEDLSELDYEEYAYGISRSSVKFDGKPYVVWRYETNLDVWLYRIEDMSDVYARVQQLGVYMGIIILAVILLTTLILYVLLKRTLYPLQELNETTKRLACGDYDQRVIVRSKDEIGELEESFNKMAEAVQESTRQLEASERRKTLFMGNLTHELKTPMTAISGYAQTLLSVKLDKEDEAEALHYIYEECGRLERLSRKMMKLLELDQDSEIVLKDTPVKQLFEAAEKSCAAVLKEKDMHLEWSENGEHYRMDMDLMTDVMINLIDNSIKASEPGGRIVLKACNQRIEVQDFGRGIPEDEKEKILEPFYMIDKSRSRKNGGAGLGLALTAIILKHHNVTLKIDSKVGAGTRMILQFV